MPVPRERPDTVHDVVGDGGLGAMETSELDSLKGAYQLLGVSFSASAVAIKKAYRRLAKKWHPDLYPHETQAHFEAIRMMGLINEAYSKIAHAPLREHTADYQRIEQQRTQSAYPESMYASPQKDMWPTGDLVELGVRVLCGGVLGLTVAALLNEGLPQYPHVQKVIQVVLLIAGGFVAARLGDRFWSWVVEGWSPWRK